MDGTQARLTSIQFCPANLILVPSRQAQQQSLSEPPASVMNMPGFPILTAGHPLTKAHFLSLYIKAPFIYTFPYRQSHVFSQIPFLGFPMDIKSGHLGPHYILSLVFLLYVIVILLL